MNEKVRAGRNRTITISEEERLELNKRIIKTCDLIENISSPSFFDEFILNKTINGDLLELLKYLPNEFANLIIIDPPYNLSKNFNDKNIIDVIKKNGLK